MTHITITPTAEVGEALQKAFPHSNVDRALTKYITALQGQLDAAILRGRTPFEHKLDLYSISLHTLTHQGGQIGPSKVRLHRWLNDNGLALVVAATKGSKFSGTLSQIKLTHHVNVDEQAMTTVDDWQSVTAQVEGDEWQQLSQVEQFERLYPGALDEPEAFRRAYDATNVNQRSLKGYIHWLSGKSCQLATVKKERELAQALYLLRSTAPFDNTLFQKKKPSAFGRTYYHGISVQSVSKTLRRAMLGKCWEYDMRTSVVAWKLGYADHYCAATGDERFAVDVFRSSFDYLLNKTELIADICANVFYADSRCDRDLQKKLVKTALTAISFGARESNKGWIGNDGQYRNPAIVEIIKNNAERQRFFGYYRVRAFMREQKFLDQYISDLALLQSPELKSREEIKSASNRLSKPKLLALLYQHAETHVMNMINDVVTENGYGVLARIHDAIVLDRPMSDGLRERMIEAVRKVTGNPHWHLCVTAHQPFVYVDPAVLKEEAAHRTRIAAEEKRAKDWAAAQGASSNDSFDYFGTDTQQLVHLYA